MVRFYILILAILILWLLSCARITAPSGGPIDKVPPKIVYVKPPMYSTRFNNKKIEIKFNEYIVLKNLTKNLLISPPNMEKPKIKLSGKKIFIVLPDSLQDNTTYIIDFGNAIADFTEGNILRNFKYVFSTGPEVDSLVLRGKVYDAFSHEPEKNMLVGLYYSLSDSVPYHHKPQYITRTDEQGNFEFTNLKDTVYYVFALADKNNNYIYDLPTEKIGFYNMKLRPYLLSNSNDTTKDTVIVDSVKAVEIPTFYEYKNKKFYIKKFYRKTPWKLAVLFNDKMDSIPVVKPLDNIKYATEISKYNDTLQIWLLDTTKMKNDTILFTISYYDNHNWQDDTLSFVMNTNKYKKKPVKILMSDKLPISPITNTIRLRINEPVNEIDTTKVLFYYTEDTLKRYVNYSIEKKFKNFDISFKKNTDVKYHLILDSAAIYSIYGNVNDSSAFNFAVRNEDDYGNLIVEWQWASSPSQIVVQLMDDKMKNVLRKNVVMFEDTSTVFNHLLSGKYAIRIIYDSNMNGKWDGGDLLLKEMPEKVLIKKDIKIKQGWDNIISLKLGSDAKR